jgi:hypothetical protein
MQTVMFCHVHISSRSYNMLAGDKHKNKSALKQMRLQPSWRLFRFINFYNVLFIVVLVQQRTSGWRGGAAGAVAVAERLPRVGPRDAVRAQALAALERHHLALRAAAVQPVGGGAHLHLTM